MNAALFVLLFVSFFPRCVWQQRMSPIILPPALSQHSVSLRTPKVARQTWGGVSSELAGHETSHDTVWSDITGTGRCPQDSTMPGRDSGNPPLLGLCYTLGSPRCPHRGGCGSAHPISASSMSLCFPSSYERLCMSCLKRQF